MENHTFTNGGFHTSGEPKWMVYTEHSCNTPIKMNDLGVPPFMETSQRFSHIMNSHFGSRISQPAVSEKNLRVNSSSHDIDDFRSQPLRHWISYITIDIMWNTWLLRRIATWVPPKASWTFCLAVKDFGSSMAPETQRRATLLTPKSYPKSCEGIGIFPGLNCTTIHLHINK